MGGGKQLPVRHGSTIETGRPASPCPEYSRSPQDAQHPARSSPDCGNGQREIFLGGNAKNTGVSAIPLTVRIPAAGRDRLFARLKVGRGTKGAGLPFNGCRGILFGFNHEILETTKDRLKATPFSSKARMYQIKPGMSTCGWPFSWA